jgi:predicted dehydrogenase
MKTLRAAVIGVGYLGRFHAQKYAAMEGVELAAVVDADPERAREIAAPLGTRALTDYRELLGKVDAVSVAVPTPLHYAVGREFLENGADCLIEKPITTSLEEADALIGLAREKGRILQAGHLERYNPAVVALDGVITRPFFIEAHRLALFKPRCTDVSVVLDLMIHDIDLILSFVKSGIHEIRAAGASVISDHVDIANARMEFENGCVANITASRISMKTERKIRVFQRDAYVSVNFADRSITVVRPGQGPGDSVIPGTDIRQISFDQGDALEAEIAAFMHSSRTREAPEVPGEAGRDALKAALTVMEQIRANEARIRAQGAS